jgi:hypothetical protein
VISQSNPAFKRGVGAESKIAQAEARFQATQKRQQEGHEAMGLYEAEGRAIREKTERLRALRLAKEAAAHPRRLQLIRNGMHERIMAAWRKRL